MSPKPSATSPYTEPTQTPLMRNCRKIGVILHRPGAYISLTVPLRILIGLLFPLDPRGYTYAVVYHSNACAPTVDCYLFFSFQHLSEKTLGSSLVNMEHQSTKCFLIAPI